MADRVFHVDLFGEELMEIYKEFVDESKEEIDQIIADTAKFARDEVKKPPPGAGRYKSWNDYNKGWTIEKKVRAYGKEYIIRNKKKPGLTHLLEDGHVLPDGRRTRAFKHVEPAAEKAIEELLRKLTNGE